MKSFRLLLLSILSGVLLWLSWYPIGIAIFVFIAFIPLFIINDKLEGKDGKLAFWNRLVYSFPAFFVWNAGTTWWIGYATIPGMLAALILNAFLMSMVFAGWCFFTHLPHTFSRRSSIPSFARPLIFIAYWCSFEFLHLNWQIAWPWLNLGNVFAPYTPFVQWYEYTGTFGGTIWILALNFLIYYLFRYWNSPGFMKYLTTTLSVFFVPILFSLAVYFSYTYNDNATIDVVIVQPNTEAKYEKSQITNLQSAQRIATLSSPYLHEADLVVAPESAIPRNLSNAVLLSGNFSHESDYYLPFPFLDSLMNNHPGLNIIAGLSTYSTFDFKERPSVRELKNGSYREYYNSVALIDSGGVAAVYHKSKLVPGVELMPYPRLFTLLENTVMKLGGFSFGVDTSQHAFQTTIADGVKIGTPICYESVFGEHFSRFVRDGAQLMAVVTNDDWWDNTAGYKQHFVCSKLRAVETRRTVIRSANSGISAFIDERGDVLQKTNFREQTAINQAVSPNDKITFYVQYGDYLAWMALLLTFFSVIFYFYRKI
ncbi:apolipoprotein N-acyltransferase, partial [Bacteroidales bacterium OttesenSCG-928-E04]|nr:apolipoprotein N-acyltransferase [Bacteroidales bacterium OttesenSCG-928-E04]MDL2326258.1 apolipoprotein N-acyltransferase [Bacteroidales bacterium OttesenSCG-928-A14]